MKYLSIFLFTFLNLFGGNFSHAATVTAAQDPWPPFVTNDPSMPGISVEILTEAMKTQGHTVNFRNMPWARALDSVKKGRIDILPAAWINDERKQYLLFSSPYLFNELSYISRASDNFSYSNLSSLKGKTVGIVRGYAYDPDFMKEPSIKRPESIDIETNIKKLKNNRVDLTIEDKIVALSTIKRLNMSPGDFIFSQPISKKSLYVTIGISNPNGKKYMNAYEKGLQIIKKNGTFDKILSKYGIK
ncbi:Cystine-binding periplasmic protein precursor [Vibrio palustris]|uniref:Cystine-binding periplasmic protein n=2 Tax=Vibrio palustris TaxID=1918946 RepID=A0A1R4B525_9VIBR|nr:transporter substrate-binding domain-containing protein [Vibrio palustris]SJL84009.1 Cystine-binding periplasmic protein precursor [Vibrio palustris]